MALNFISVSLHPKPPGPSFLNPKHKNQFKLHLQHPLSSFRTATQTEGTQGGGVTEEDPQTYPGMVVFLLISQLFLVGFV